MEAARKLKAERGVSSALTPSSQELPPAEDIAPITVWLATDAAAGVNGCTFGSKGGTIELHTDPVPIKSIHKEGRWTLDELDEVMPRTLAQGLVNPAPPQQPKA
jgi:hypothetical protein